MTFSKRVKNEIFNTLLEDDIKYVLIWTYFILYEKDDSDFLTIKSKNKLSTLFLYNFIRNNKIIPYKYNIDNNSITISIFDINQFLKDTKDKYDKNDFLSYEEILILQVYFLFFGSINSPETSEYHLEFSINNQRISLLIQHILNKYELNSKITKRKNRLVVYIKEAEKISDFLKIINCDDNLFYFEDNRISRDLNNSINRLINIEIYNEKKILKSANKDMQLISAIKKRYTMSSINPKLVEIIKIRSEYPEASLSELADKYFKKYNKKISKSGINHRMKKLYELI